MLPSLYFPHITSEDLELRIAEGDDCLIRRVELLTPWGRFDAMTFPHLIFGAAYARVSCGLNTPTHVLYQPEKHRLQNLSSVETLKLCIILHVIANRRRCTISYYETWRIQRRCHCKWGPQHVPEEYLSNHRNKEDGRPSCFAPLTYNSRHCTLSLRLCHNNWTIRMR